MTDQEETAPPDGFLAADGDQVPDPDRDNLPQTVDPAEGSVA